MAKKQIKRIIVILVLIHFIISSTSGLWQNIAWAKEENLGEMIEFQAYFQEKDQVKSKLIIERNNELVVRITLQKQGILNDLVLQLKQANFRIKTDEINDSRIQDIQEDTGEITLAPVSSGSTLELILPIEFKQQSQIETNYFSQEAVFLIKGNYKQDEKVTQAVSQELSVALQWTSETSIQASEEVEKYLSIPGKGVLLQTKITTQVLDNRLPKEQESLSIQSVKLKNQYPKEIIVLVNGQKQIQGVSYEANTGKLTIHRELSANASTLNWGEGKENYQILAYYDVAVGTAQTTISLSTSLETKLFTQTAQTQTLERQVTIKPMGNVVDLSVTSTPELVKGYLYAQSEKNTIYEQTEKIGISDVTQVGPIIITEENPSFITSQNKKLAAQNSISYQNTQIDAQSLKTILGQNGKLTIKQEDGTLIAELTSTSPVQEQGIYRITYQGAEAKNLQYIFTDLAQEGEITLTHQKAIAGNTGYDISTLKKVEQLSQKITAKTTLGQESKTMTMTMRDTKAQAELSVSQEQWQTLQTNDHMTIDFTFLSDDPSQDLYRNPTLEIELPAGIEDITVHSINKAHSDEFEITKAGMITNEQGKRILQVKLQGTQTKYHDTFTKGLTLSFDITVRLKKDIPSHEEEMIARYTNENRSGQTFEMKKQIQLVSKYGSLVYTKVHEYNEAGETKEATNGMVQTANLDSQHEERKASADIILMNNYDSSLEEISIIGTLPGKEKVSLGDKTLESTGDNLTLLSVMTQEQGITIWYSPETKPKKESQSWTQNPEGAKSFKLELPNHELTPTQVIHVHVEFMIQANLKQSQKAYLKIAEEYQYEGKQAEAYSAIQFIARGQGTDISLGNESSESQITQTIDGLQLQTKVTSNGKVLQDGSSVYEGQTITYELKVTNQTGNEMRNLKLNADHTNAVFYGYVEKQIIATEGEEDFITEIRYEEDETIKQKQMTIDLLKPNETITETYEFTVRLRDENQELTQGNLQLQADNWETKTIPLMSHPIESAELKATLNFTLGVDKFLETRTTTAFGVTVENLTEESQNAIVVLPFPEWMTYNTENMDPEYQLLSTDEHQLQLKVENIPAKEKKAFTVFFDLNDLPNEQKETRLSLRAKVSTETGKQYESNTITKTVKASSKGLQLTLASNVKQEPLVHEQEVVFTGTLENLDDTNYSEVEVNYQIPDGFLVKKAYWYFPGGDKQEIAFEESQSIFFTLNEIPAKAKLEFVLEGIIDCTYLSVGQTEITGYYTAYTNGSDYSSNRLVYEVKPIEPEEPDGPDVPDIPDVPEIPDDPEIGTHQISGMTWIDANKNGVKDRNEEPLNQVNVLLLSIDEKGNITTKQKAQTDETGYYQFTSLPEGQYVVGFAYDTTKYRMTQYQKEGIHESLNSDAFSQKKYDNQLYAVTDTLSITKEDLANLDAGFIPNEKFDLRLDKAITQVVVQYPSGVKVYQYDQAQLAKVEIEAKKINQTSVVVEYQIKVTNEGELTGYINDIVDYLPADFKFSSELNKDWYSAKEGKLHNVSLSNEPIEPGKTKTVSLTLTKTMNSNNVGLTVNTAELQRTSNDMSFADIDSVAGNHKKGEDDISSAELIISVKTGLVAVISTGVILGLFLLVAFILWQLKRREDHEKRNTQD